MAVVQFSRNAGASTSAVRDLVRAGVKASAILGALLLASAQVSAGVISSASSRAALAGNDQVQWGTSTDDLIDRGVSSSFTSGGGIGVVASAVGGMYTVVQGGGNSGFGGNFLDGEVLLSTLFGDGPITFEFSKAVRGVGFNIQHIAVGNFSATLDFYGSDPNSSAFGSVMVSGNSNFNADGSAVFLGGKSSAVDIMRIVVSVDTHDFSSGLTLNEMSLLTTEPGTGGGGGGGGNPIPEPGSLSLVALAAVATLVAGKRRRRIAVGT